MTQMWWQHQFPTSGAGCELWKLDTILHSWFWCFSFSQSLQGGWETLGPSLKERGKKTNWKGNRSYRTINKQGNVAPKGKQGETQWTNKLCISATDRDGLRLSYRALFSQFVLGIDKQVTLHMSSQTSQQFSTPMKKGGRCQAGWVAVFSHSQPRLWALINTLVGSPNSSPAISSQCWRPAAYLPSNSLSADQLAHSGSRILGFLCRVLFLPVPLVLLRKHFRSEQWSLWIFASWTPAQLHSAHLPALPPPSSWAVGHSQVKDAHPATCSRSTPETLSTYF